MPGKQDGGPADAIRPRLASPHVELGKTGLQVSRLAFGTGTHGIRGHSDQSALGVGTLADLLLAGYDAGVNFWDTADEYGTHPHVARALQQVDRDKVVVLTKTMARDRDRVARDVDRFLVELGMEVIDVVLLHFLSSSDWPRRFSGALEALSRAKDAGKVKAVGVSCHSLSAIKAAADTDWADVVMAQINSSGVQMDRTPDIVIPVLADLNAAGVGIVGMKVLGAGKLVSDVRAQIEYIFNLGVVPAITIGMTNRGELAENLGVVSSVG